jgi:hypothetical protein
MEYVELLRVRRSLIWNAGILAVVVIGILALGGDSTIHVNGGTTRIAAGASLPLGVIATIGAFLAAIYASSIGTSLNRESTTRDISWTKPVSRTVLAIRFVAIDLAGVLIAFAVAIILICLALAYLHVSVAADTDAPGQLVLGCGIGAMWYGLLQVLTCGFGSGARAMAGILWPISLVCQGLAELGGGVGQTMRAIDVLNPIGYLDAIAKPAAGGPEMAAPLVWFFALAFCALAIVIWPRREA